MPKHTSKSTSKSSSTVLPINYNAFPCRLCKRPHPLRRCRKFLDMNVSARIGAVREHKYCTNCLAHDHSHGTCFSKHGCKQCHKFHHTLLHVNPRLQKDLSTSRRRSRSHSPATTSSRPSRSRNSSTSKTKRNPSPPTTSKATLSTIIRQNTITLHPTVLAKIGSKTAHARCLLDTGSLVSRVSKNLVDKLKLTAYCLNDETICPLVLKSRYDSTSKIEGTFRVDNRITLKTPSQQLPDSCRNNFKNLFLADSQFYESGQIDIIIGVDLYPKVITEGIISKPGFPTAQSTLFGWTIYGPYSL